MKKRKLKIKKIEGASLKGFLRNIKKKIKGIYLKILLRNKKIKLVKDKVENKEIKNTKPQEPSLSQVLQDLVDTLRSHDRGQVANKKLDGITICFKNLRIIIISLILLAFILLLFFFIHHELSKEVILIEHFEVHKELKDKGYTSKVIINKLMDKINEIRNTTNPRMKRKLKSKEVIATWSEPQIELEIPGGGISLSSIIQYIKKSYRPKRTHIVVGEVLYKNKQIHMTVRVSGKPAKTIDPGELKDLKKILLQAAEYIYKSVEPFILASYLYNQNLLLTHYEEESENLYNKKDNNKNLETIETIKYILSHDPPSDDYWAYNLWGVILRDQEDYKGAIDKFKKAIEIDPRFALAYNTWGLVLRDQEDYKGAVDKFKKAIEIDPRYAHPYNGWGVALRNLGDHKGAIAKYKKSIELDRRFSFPYNNWGFVLLKQGDYEGAIDKFQKAIDLAMGEDDAFPYNNWGNALLKQRKYDDAIDKFQKAEKSAKLVRGKKVAFTYYYWGNALLEQEDYEGAIDKYKKAIELDHAPTFALAHNKWGIALTKQKNYEDAVDKFKEAIKHNPTYALAYISLGFVLLKRGNYEGAIDKFQSAIGIISPFGKGVWGLKKFFYYYD